MIEHRQLPYAAIAEGFTKEVPKFMQISDVVVCKPGPGVVTEATCIGLPVVVEFNVSTLAQEVTVALWVEQEAAGMLWRCAEEVGPSAAPR